MRLLDRRTVLTGATAVATSALAPSLSIVPAMAAAPPSGKQAPSFYRHKVGDFEITVLSDGIFQTKMERSPARNASLEEVQAALSASFMPADQTVFHFNQNVVNTGSKLVLIDTGNFPGRPGTGLTLSNLTASGIDPKAVDVVIISHFHQDHIGGLRTANGDLIYPNAEIMVPAVEWAHWMDDAKMNAAPENARGGFQNVRKIFGPIADKITKYEWGKELVPGITSMGTPGHTPGHTSFVVASGIRQDGNPKRCDARYVVAVYRKAGLASERRYGRTARAAIASEAVRHDRDRSNSIRRLSHALPRPRLSGKGRRRVPVCAGAVESDRLRTF